MKPFENSRTVFRSTLIAAALAVGLGATGASLAETGNTAAPQPRSDSAGPEIADTVITAAVKAKYMMDERLSGSDIGVTTTNGVVTLTGTVAKVEYTQVAIEVAKAVEGVNSVDSSGLSASGV